MVYNFEIIEGFERTMLKKKGLRILAWGTGFLLIFSYLQAIFIPNWEYNPQKLKEGETNRYMEFYEEDKDSLDYLILGVSHSYYSVNPLQIYADTGLKGYNLGSPNQSLSISYYWLAEACKYQTPSVVFLDIASLLYPQEHLFDSGNVAKALLYMKPSFNKLEAVINSRVPGQTIAELLVPMIQFHSRWEELGIADWNKPADGYYLKGANLRFESQLYTDKAINRYWGENYQLVEEDIEYSNSAMEVEKANIKYFEALLELCQDKGIRLIPIKFPTMAWDSSRSAAVRSFLNHYNLELIDLTNSNVFDNINWEKDTPDTGNHTNYYGATKTSFWLSEFLTKKLNIRNEKSTDYKWDNDLKNYEIWEQTQLATDLQKSVRYLQGLSEYQDDFYIICSVRDEACDAWNSFLQKKIEKLGLKGNFGPQNVQNSYIAIIDRGKVRFEKWSGSPLTLVADIKLEDGETLPVEIQSCGFTYGDKSSILINGVEHSLNRRGLNIVVVETNTGNVVSSVAIDSHIPFLDFSGEPWKSGGNYEPGPIIEDGVYSIASVGNQNAVLAVNADGQIVLEEPDGSLEQKFQIYYIGEGYYNIKTLSERAIGIKNYGSTKGVVASTGGDSRLAGQKWFIAQNENNTYSLISLYNGLVLDDSDENGSLEGVPSLRENNYSSAQQFILQKID